MLTCLETSPSAKKVWAVNGPPSNNTLLMFHITRPYHMHNTVKGVTKTV